MYTEVLIVRLHYVCTIYALNASLGFKRTERSVLHSLPLFAVFRMERLVGFTQQTVASLSQLANVAFCRIWCQNANIQTQYHEFYAIDQLVLFPYSKNGMNYDRIY